jgi:signal transduction histidine kinase
MGKGLTKQPRLGKVDALAAGAIILLGTTLALSFYLAQTYARSSRWISQTMLVKDSIAELLATLAQAETGQRAYVLTGREEYLRPYRHAKEITANQLRDLAELTVDDQKQQALMVDVNRLVAAKFSELERVIEQRDRGGRDAALSIIDTDEGVRPMEQLQSTLDDMTAEENSLLLVRRALQQRFRLLSLVSMLVTSLLSGLFATTAWLWTRSTDVRRRAAEAEASRLRAENDAMAVQQRTAEFQERFVGILGHDLRDPLSSIAMGGQLLRLSPPSRHPEMIEGILASAARMARMIDQILDLTRSRLGGGIAIRPASANLGVLVAQVADEMRAAHPARQMLVETDGDLEGEWDTDRLAQVVSNLIGNAIAHGAPDHPVQVKLHGEGQHVDLVVQNFGATIPKELGAVLFDPFRRGEREGGSSRTSGLGLGLFISREIVVAHGGTIDFSSNDSEGTMFCVSLPRKSHLTQATASDAGSAGASPRPNQAGFDAHFG